MTGRERKRERGVDVIKQVATQNIANNFIWTIRQVLLSRANIKHFQLRRCLFFFFFSFSFFASIVLYSTDRQKSRKTGSRLQLLKKHDCLKEKLN